MNVGNLEWGRLPEQLSLSLSAFSLCVPNAQLMNESRVGDVYRLIDGGIEWCREDDEVVLEEKVEKGRKVDKAGQGRTKQGTVGGWWWWWWLLRVSCCSWVGEHGRWEMGEWLCLNLQFPFS